MIKKPFLYGALAVAGYFAYRAIQTAERTKRSGTVTLRGGVPYGYELLQPFVTGTSDLRSTTVQKTLTDSLLKQGAQNVTYGSDAAGVHVHFVLTPPTTVSVDIGKLAYGGAVVHSLTRLDGKNWDV